MGLNFSTYCVSHHDFVYIIPSFCRLLVALLLFHTDFLRLLVVYSTSCFPGIGFMSVQVRNQIASFEQKLREAEHKLRLREKEIVDIQVRRSSVRYSLSSFSNTNPTNFVYLAPHPQTIVPNVPRTHDSSSVVPYRDAFFGLPFQQYHRHLSFAAAPSCTNPEQSYLYSTPGNGCGFDHESFI